MSVVDPIFHPIPGSTGADPLATSFMGGDRARLDAALDAIAATAETQELDWDVEDTTTPHGAGREQNSLAIALEVEGSAVEGSAGEGSAGEGLAATRIQGEGVEAVIPKQASPDDAKSGDVNAEDASLEDASLEDANPEDANSEDASLEDANPEDANPEDANPDESQDLQPERQVRFKPAEKHIDLLLPLEAENPNPETAIELEDSDLWQQLQQRLTGSDRFWTAAMPVHLHAYNRLLDTRQLQAIADTLASYDLKLSRIVTYRRQTAVAAVTAGYSVDQQAEPPKLLFTSEPTEPASAPPPLAEPLYLQTTVRSGTEINHRGTVIILGDLNPGSSVVADGDILVWGRLRGVAHAGAAGNRRCLIMALQMQPTQLRIADAVARVPSAQPNTTPQPEVAYITQRSIRITAAAGFVRPTT